MEQLLAELSTLRSEFAVGKMRDALGPRWTIVKRIVRQLPFATTSTEMQTIVQKYVRMAEKAREKGNYVKARKKLQQAKALLQPRGSEDALLSMQMGQVHAYFGEWKAAEAELKQGLKAQLSTNSTSELKLKLSNTLMELYHQQDMLDEAVQQGEWTLDQSEGSEFAFEQLRALYFLGLLSDR